MPSKSPFPCPICGGTVPAKAKACPHCGACDKTGWNGETTDYDGLDLPDEDFDYEKFKEDEFGESKRLKGKRLFWWWVTVIIILIVIFLTFSTNTFLRG